MLVSRFGASPWYIQWSKVSAPTCPLCASGCVAFLLRETSGAAMMLTLSCEDIKSGGGSEAAIQTNETFPILDP